MKTCNDNLIDAIKSGDIAGVRVALAAGADVHVADDLALRRASSKGQVKVVQTLLAAGANANAGGLATFHLTALGVAAENGHIDTVSVLINAGAAINADDDYALFWAAHHGHVEVVRLLLSAGADVHSKNDAPLRVSAYHGHTHVVNVLLLAGADPEAAWSSAQTHARPAIAATFDACIDAMASAQRTAIMKKSHRFVGLHAAATSTNKRRALCR